MIYSFSYMAVDGVIMVSNCNGTVDCSGSCNVLHTVHISMANMSAAASQRGNGRCTGVAAPVFSEHRRNVRLQAPKAPSQKTQDWISPPRLLFVFISLACPVHPVSQYQYDTPPPQRSTAFRSVSVMCNRIQTHTHPDHCPRHICPLPSLSLSRALPPRPAPPARVSLTPEKEMGAAWARGHGGAGRPTYTT